MQSNPGEPAICAGRVVSTRRPRTSSPNAPFLGEEIAVDPRQGVLERLAVAPAPAGTFPVALTIKSL
jgi:hypothetical protein